MISRRQGQSDFLDTVVTSMVESAAGKKKVASAETDEKQANLNTNHPAAKISADETTDKVAEETVVEEKVAGSIAGPGIPDGTGPNSGTEECPLKDAETTEMTLHQARVARREGRFSKVAGRNDLYQEANTNAFWKLSDDNQKVVRTFEDINGVVTE